MRHLSRQIAAVARKEFLQQRRTWLSLLHRLLIGPGISVALVYVPYQAFFRETPNVKLGGLTAENFQMQLILAFLLHMHLNAGYYFASNKWLHEWHQKTLGTLVLSPCSPLTFIVGGSLVDLTKCLMVSLAVGLLFRELPWYMPLVLTALFFWAVLLGSLRGWIHVLRSGFAEFIDYAYIASLFLGGLYFPASLLPSPLAILARLNPVYYAHQALAARANTALNVLMLGICILALALVLHVSQKAFQLSLNRRVLRG